MSRSYNVIALMVMALFGATVHADDSAARAQALIDKGLAFLKTQQKADKTWQEENQPPAITAIVLKAFVGDSKYSSDSMVNEGFDALLKSQKPNGAIYIDQQANYNTAIAVSALAASKQKEYQPNIDKAVAFLKKLQWSDDPIEAEGQRKTVTEKEPAYGGFGYGRKERPDGSNLQLALDALKDAGLKPDDPAFQRAIKFVTRMQNLSETNDQSWAGNDGGFVYTPANNGESFAGEYTSADGKRMLRSYGSMTYAGLKSFIYAGLTKDDQRVKAAVEWIGKNWTLDENPGMKLGDPKNAQHGMYYYYHTLARSLNAYDDPTITDTEGKKHDWRAELIDKLASLQRPDGSWAGEQRWMEDNPVLVTAYCVIALQEAKQDLGEHAGR